jgi:hypothetical protein
MITIFLGQVLIFVGRFVKLNSSIELKVPKIRELECEFRNYLARFSIIGPNVVNYNSGTELCYMKHHWVVARFCRWIRRM